MALLRDRNHPGISNNNSSGCVPSSFYSFFFLPGGGSGSQVHREGEEEAEEESVPRDGLQQHKQSFSLFNTAEEEGFFCDGDGLKNRNMRALLGSHGPAPPSMMHGHQQQQQLVLAGNSATLLREHSNPTATAAAAALRHCQLDENSFSRGVGGDGGRGGGGGRREKDEDEERDPYENDDDVENSSFCSSAEEFENMVGDLRRTFIGWLRKTESDLKKEKRDLQRARQEFEEEKQQAWQQLQEAKISNHEKIKEERRKAQAEAAAQLKQIQTEREDARRKLNAERLRFDEEKELHRRKALLESERLRQEAETLEAEKRRIVDTNIATETVVDINVGGVIFEAARHTLQQQQGSYLHTLLSGRHHVARDRQGRLFLDRDAELFRIILNFLRNPSTPPQPRDACESDAITQEAQYLGIHFFPFPLVFCMGGHNGIEHLPSVEVLDVAQQCWRSCTRMQTERAYFASSNFQNKLFVYGGQNLDYKALCDTEIFDCLRDCWIGGATLNIPRRNTCGAYVKGRHFAIGGFDGENILSAVECYDPRMKNWMSISSLNTPRSSAMACVNDEVLYVLGGTSGERLRTVERYDARVNKWETLAADMIEVRSAGAAACDLAHVLVMGGIDSSNNILNSVEVLDPQSRRWTFLSNMPEPRMDCAAVSVAGSILVTGGQAEEVLSSTSFLRQERNEWQSGPAMLSPRYGHGLVVASL